MVVAAASRSGGVDADDASADQELCRKSHVPLGREIRPTTLPGPERCH